MELSKASERSPFSSLRNELARLKGVLQRINQSIGTEAEILAEDPAAPPNWISPDCELAVQPNKTKTVKIESEAATLPDHEKRLNEKILELENQVRTKEWLLKTRDAQIKKLRAELVEAKISLMTEGKDKWDGQGWRKLWKQAVGS
jgi:hypothetical protein